MDENSNREYQRSEEESRRVIRVPEYSFWAEQVSEEGRNQETPKADYYRASNPDNENDIQTSYYNEVNESADSNIAFSRPEPIEEISQGKERKRRFIPAAIRAMIFGLLAGGAFLFSIGLYHYLVPESNTGDRYILGGAQQAGKEDETGQLKIGVTEGGTVKRVAHDAVSAMVKETKPSLVSITSISTQQDIWYGQEYTNEGSGSGIIVGQNDTEILIATNNHVVEGTNQITVIFIDGSEVNAVIKGTDVMADLAVIAVDIENMKQSTLDEIRVAKLGDSDKMEVGQMAVAIGNAQGYGQSTTVGYISAKDRKIEIADNYSYKTMILLQTDAAINPGNSGGALLNIDGEVIGINTVKYISNDVERMGYAIPISRAIPIINDLMNREILAPGEQGFLGVATRDVTEEVSRMYNMPIGVFVSEVVADSAAEKAKIQPGDIITKINDIEITSRVQLSETISSIRSGTEVEITYMRGIDGSYQERKVSVVLGVRPVDE